MNTPITKQPRRKKHIKNTLKWVLAPLAFNALFFGTWNGMIEGYKQHELDSRADKCRVKQFVIENDLTHTYLCESVKNETVYFINETESQKLQENPYINRPVIIYKNGKVK